MVISQKQITVRGDFEIIDQGNSENVRSIKDELAGEKGTRQTRLKLVIDLGNGDVKALGRSGSPHEEVWQKTKFPSAIAQTMANPDFVLNGQGFIVGKEARTQGGRKSGRTSSGKIENAPLLIAKALVELFDLSQSAYVVDVIFSCPSCKQYGSLIKDAIASLGERWRLEFVDNKGQQRTTTIYTRHLKDHLECYFAVYELAPKLLGKKPVALIDIGDRTQINQEMRANMQIVSRSVADDAGVRKLTKILRSQEVLANFDGVPLTPSDEDLMSVLFARKNAKNDALIELLTPYMQNAFSDAIAYANEQLAKGCAVYVIGGGAGLCGLRSLFPNKVKFPRSSQWSNVRGLANQWNALIGSGVA